MTRPPEHVADRPVNYSTYVNHGCGCEGCRAAFREYMRAWRARNRDKELARYARTRDKRSRGLWKGSR